MITINEQKKEVELTMQRASDNKVSTIGELLLNDSTIYTIEDTGRDYNHDGDFDDQGEGKVYGKTRVLKGRYEIKLRKEGSLHEKYKERFSFHRGMLHLQNVSHFQYIYLHIANWASQLLGCVGLGSKKISDNEVGESEKAYIYVYGYICAMFDLGYRVFLNIKDENKL